MDPNILLNYEVIYETLSASESDSDTDITTDKNIHSGKVPKVNERRKVIKNFTICNPTANARWSNNESTVRTSSAGIPEILSDVSSAKNTENNGCLIQSSDLNREKPLKASTSDFNDPNPLNGSIGKEKEKLKETNWANAVNCIGKGGPSMKDIKHVIEGTIFKVLNEDLVDCSNNNKNSAIDTSKKKCPHCEFQTLSRFSLKKHVALHENKPQLVFSQGIVEKPADTIAKTSLSAKKFVCCNCSDLFRTETALKLHNCISLAQSHNSDIKINKVLVQNSSVNSSKEPVIVTALKFLSRKPIDIDTKREEVNLENSKIGDKKYFKKTLLECEKIEQEASTSRKDSSRKADVVGGNTKDVKYLRTILEEPALIKNNSCSSINSKSEEDIKMDKEIKIEPYEIVWESVKTECKNELLDENIKNEPEDSQCDMNMYDDLERRMAILTGEENNGVNVETQNWMGFSESNGSDQHEPIQELPIEIKYNNLLLNNVPNADNVAVNKAITEKIQQNKGKENTNAIVSNELENYPINTNNKIIINNNKVNIGARISIADNFPEREFSSAFGLLTGI